MEYFDINKISIGTDLAEVGRFSGLVEKGKFLKNIFTKKEIKECQKKQGPAESLAARFAGKEAVKKTIKENLGFNEIELVNDKSGALKVKFLNKKIEKKYKSLISISHTHLFAQAVCITFKKHE